MLSWPWCKILWGETRARGYLFMREKKNKFKARNYSHPLYNIRLMYVGEWGYFSSAVVIVCKNGQLFWLIDLIMDLFIFPTLWYRLNVKYWRVLPLWVCLKPVHCTLCLFTLYNKYLMYFFQLKAIENMKEGRIAKLYLEWADPWWAEGEGYLNFAWSREVCIDTVPRVGRSLVSTGWGIPQLCLV